MNLEALLGLLQGQDLGKLAEQVGGNSTEVKKWCCGSITSNIGGS